MLKIPDGTCFTEEADQWHELSYTVFGNRIFPSYTDRHDPDHEEGKGMSIEEFLASPTVKPWSKDWIREMVAKYTE